MHVNIDGEYSSSVPELTAVNCIKQIIVNFLGKQTNASSFDLQVKFFSLPYI